MQSAIFKMTLGDPLKHAMEGFVKQILTSFQTSLSKEASMEVGQQAAQWLQGIVSGMFMGSNPFTSFFGSIGSFFGLGGGGLTPANHPGSLHSGGVVPRTGQYGLIKGERVLSNQQARIPNTGPASGIYLKPQVNINNTQSDKVDVSVEEGDDGSLNINLYDAMDNMLAQTIAKPGNFQEAMLGITGSKRPVLSR